jgi:hypothetical protein
VVVAARVAVGHGVAVGVPGPLVAVVAIVGVMSSGLGVTVTARGVATLPGQQSAMTAVAWASAWVGGGAQLANAIGKISRMRNGRCFIVVLCRRSVLEIEYIRLG